MCFHMLNSCWSNTKRFLCVLVVFGKYFVFAKIVKIFKNSVALFWRLSRGLVQSHAPVTSLHRDFSPLTSGSMSQSRKILRIFFKILGLYVSRGSIWRLVRGWKVQLQGVHRDFRGSPRDFLAVRLSNHEKHLENISNFCFLSVLVAGPGDLHTTWFSHENCVFCTKWISFWTFFSFPSNISDYSSSSLLETLSNSPCHS